MFMENEIEEKSEEELLEEREAERRRAEKLSRGISKTLEARDKEAKALVESTRLRFLDIEERNERLREVENVRLNAVAEMTSVQALPENKERFVRLWQGGLSTLQRLQEELEATLEEYMSVPRVDRDKAVIPFLLKQLKTVQELMKGYASNPYKSDKPMIAIQNNVVGETPPASLEPPSVDEVGSQKMKYAARTAVEVVPVDPTEGIVSGLSGVLDKLKD